MADLIDRQAAIYAMSIAWLNGAYYTETMNALKELPSADAIEVIRCKDCKYYDLAKNGINGVCNRQYGSFNAYDFCSYGERVHDGS